MDPAVLHLEELRREYERTIASTESYAEAIERGWTKETPEAHKQIEEGRDKYQALEEKIFNLCETYWKHKSYIVDNWVQWHLDACLLMHEELLHDEEDKGVEIICIKNLILALGRLVVGPGKKIFTVNTHYLKTYYEYLERKC